MIHLRIVAPEEIAHHALDLLCESPSVLNVVHFHAAARKPAGDVILCDVAKEDASVILADLKELEIPRVGSIAIEHVDTQISDAADEAERAAPGMPSDAVVWEEVQQRTSEDTELSISYVTFMVLAMQIAAVGILFDQPILIVGAMVVGPEFGPLAGLSVALVHRQPELARRSIAALALGFPVGIGVTLLTVALFRWTGLKDDYQVSDDVLTGFISHPDFFSFFVAYVAGTAGVLSLTSAKSGALIGVLISVTTIPAAANIAVGIAYGEWGEAGGAAAQLVVNLTSITMAGVVTLFVQRRYYVTRRRKHLSDPARSAAGLPLGHSTHPRRGPPRRDEFQEG
ncbi:MAG TPA: DUF389 domain-containing protein [Thermoleophilaceae bacterium]|nr:DUF389 domain-containing protein [Thermoleophilaceae bacterium]